MTKWQIERWLSDAEIKDAAYAPYWNNEEFEKQKEWYVLDGNFQRMEGYLNQLGLPANLQDAIEALKHFFNRRLIGTGVDLAAGNLWAAPHLFRLGAIEKLYCVEYSIHRLLHLGPLV